MDHPSRIQSSSRKKKSACKECRQQKMKCSFNPNLNKCQRCSKLNISCEISVPFKRIHKRKKLEELENETNELKRQLRSVVEESTSSGVVLSNLPSGVQYGFPYNQTTTRTDEISEPRFIEGLEIGTCIIDDCFELYFDKFHPILPILDSSITPNTYYNTCPILFWMVISIGSRRYKKHPTLLTALSSRVTNLTLSSLCPRYKPLEVIKAIILFITWPFSSAAFYRDNTFVITGALIHMAMQYGLHEPYLRLLAVKDDRLTAKANINVTSKATIWAHVVMAYQRSASSSGHASLSPLDTYIDNEKFQTVSNDFNSSLNIELKISCILLKAQRTFLELGLDKKNVHVSTERKLESLIQNFLDQLNQLEVNNENIWEHFHLLTARQEISIMYFFKSKDSFHVQDCQVIWNCTTNLLEFINNLEQQEKNKFSNYATKSQVIAVAVASSSIHRILKCRHAIHLDHIRGEELYYFSIKVLKSSSLELGDLQDKISAYLEQSWKSDKIFKTFDGSIDISLKVRNRFNASSFYDSLKWWREEYLNSSDPTTTSDLRSLEKNFSNESRKTSPLPPSNEDANSSSLIAPNTETSPKDFFEDLWNEFELGFGADYDFGLRNDFLGHHENMIPNDDKKS